MSVERFEKPVRAVTDRSDALSVQLTLPEIRGLNAASSKQSLAAFDLPGQEGFGIYQGGVAIAADNLTAQRSQLGKDLSTQKITNIVKDENGNAMNFTDTNGNVWNRPPSVQDTTFAYETKSPEETSDEMNTNRNQGRAAIDPIDETISDEQVEVAAVVEQNELFEARALRGVVQATA